MVNDCGTCTLCCKVMGVPDLNKLPGEWCVHCDPKVGCKIYDDRPESCKDFECLWLQAQTRPDDNMAKKPELRPDKCKGVVVTTADSEGVVIKTDPNRPNAHLTGPLKRLVDSTPRLVWIVQFGGAGPAKALNETATRACYKRRIDPNRIIAADEWREEVIKRKRERGNTE